MADSYVGMPTNPVQAGNADMAQARKQGLSNMVPVPSKSNSFATPSNGDAPTGGTSIKGFGGGKPDSSTVGGSLAKADKAPGTAVRGFSGGGMLSGKV